ncbi:MAG: hypothetical protein DMD85_18220 [Candidatus Rokuibacteriota bacterium]|nr:MAG: hypothetical protein DMD85_18220 [Candidatus Rokubacteria bacterium]
MAVKRRRWEPVAFASPSLALIALVILFPLAYSFYLSLQNFDLAVGPEHDFVGAKNYIEALFKDGRFLGSIWNTAVIIAPSLVCELLLGLGIALLLGRMTRGRPIVTALLAIPAIDGKVVHRPAITPGRGMAVSIYSKKKEATMKVLEFISTPDQSLKIVMDPKTIMDPWRLSHLKSPIFRKAFPDADKYLDAIEATFPYLVPDPVIPAADEYQRKLSFEITEALAKRKAPKDALDTAAAEWEKITERRGRDKQKAQWGEKLAEMKSLGIEYHPDWAAKAK